jgi:hypothetical protein
LSTFLTGVLPPLLSGFAAAGLTAWLTGRRFYRERWWEKKHDAYSTILNSLHVIYRGYDVERFRDRTRGPLTEAEIDDLRFKHNSGHAELSRLIDVGEFLISAETIVALQQLGGILMFYDEQETESIIKCGDAINDCMARVRQLAKADLDPPSSFVVMNWKRGLIRLWLISSVFWVVASGWLTWSYDNTRLFDYIYDAATHNGRSKRAFETWRDQTTKNARPWKDMKFRIWANHGLQPPNILTLGDLIILEGSAPNPWWKDADFCTKEFNGIATDAECDELKRVAAAIPVVPTPPEAEAWISRERISVQPLIEWAGPVFVPPIAALLIVAALTWALRGFRRA